MSTVISAYNFDTEMQKLQRQFGKPVFHSKISRLIITWRSHFEVDEIPVTWSTQEACNLLQPNLMAHLPRLTAEGMSDRQITTLLRMGFQLCGNCLRNVVIPERALAATNVSTCCLKCVPYEPQWSHCYAKSPTSRALQFAPNGDLIECRMCPRILRDDPVVQTVCCKKAHHKTCLTAHLQRLDANRIPLSCPVCSHVFVRRGEDRDMTEIAAALSRGSHGGDRRRRPP